MLPAGTDVAPGGAGTTRDRPTLVVAVAGADVPLFPTSPFAIIIARSTGEAIYLLTCWQPRLVAVAWDATAFDAQRICAVALTLPDTAILATLAAPANAPQALTAGCHALLLKPLTVNLVVARLSRLAREGRGTAALRLAGTPGVSGTNLPCRHIACPDCDQHGAVAFEHASHRRVWYACLRCNAVWVGRSHT
jgi:CheY-like chemotaxis protein